MLETINSDVNILIVMFVMLIAIYAIAGIIVHKLNQLEKPTKEQEECEHDWHIITPPFNRANRFTIYCPKCKYEKKVSDEEWAKMQIDKDYEAGIERCEEK